jgi:hypothetical protein
MLCLGPGGGDAQGRYVTSSQAAAISLAENYSGLPYGS